MSMTTFTQANPLILASASERRLDLLRQVGIEPVVQAANIDESLLPNEAPEALVQRLARQKAATIIDRPLCTVLAADTVVTLNHHIYGKPLNEEHAVEMLLSLSGRQHSVFSGVCVRQNGVEKVICVRSLVTFCEISAAEAKQYWQSGEPKGKAGGYAIQGIGAVFIAHLEGSYSNVVGLPLFETVQLLKQW